MKLFVSLALLGLGAAAPFGAGQEDKTGPASGSQDDINGAVDIHNQARAAVGSPPIAWDDTLAQHAQAYAEQLAPTGQLTHSSGDSRPGEGENLFQGWVSGTTPSNTDGYKIASEWFIDEEIAKYQCGQVIDDSNYSHYTQIIWSNTTRLGMGYAVGAGGKSFVVARYSAPGNIIGEMACPAGATPYTPSSSSGSGSQTSQSSASSSPSASPSASPTPTPAAQPSSQGSSSSGSTSSGSSPSGQQPPSNVQPTSPQGSWPYRHHHYPHAAAKTQADATDDECDR